MSLIHILLGPADFNEQIPDRDDCIYWRDDLSIGPVPATEKLEDLSRIRESFWKTSTPLARLSDEGRKRAIEKGGAGQLPERIELAQRDEQIRRLADSSELVIWCASNRREILMLLALVNSLDAVSARNMRITVAPCATWGP